MTAASRNCAFCGCPGASFTIGAGRFAHPSCVIATVASDVHRFDALNSQLGVGTYPDNEARERVSSLDLAAFPAGEAALFSGASA